MAEPVIKIKIIQQILEDFVVEQMEIHGISAIKADDLKLVHAIMEAIEEEGEEIEEEGEEIN